MANKRLVTKISKGLIAIFILIFILIVLIRSLDYRNTISVNWGVKLPKNYEITYSADSGAGPFNDGFRLHVFYYEKGINTSFLNDFSDEKDKAMEEEVNNILSHLEIDPEESVDFNQPYKWKRITYIPDGGIDIATKGLYLIYQPHNNCLYVVDYKI